MNSRYSVMTASAQADVSGSPYPDPLTFPIDDLKITVEPKQYQVTQADLDRFDIVVATEYGSAQYDDIVLWFNKISDVHAVSPGDILLFPDRGDLDSFVSRNRA